MKLIEFPDAISFVKSGNSFTSFPKFVIESDYITKIKIKYWNVLTPNSTTIIESDELVLLSVNQNIDYIGIFEEYDSNDNLLATYYSNDFLTYTNHIKISDSGFSGREIYKYQNYVDLSSHEGVKYDSTFKTSGIQGIGSYQGKIIPVNQIIDNSKNRIQFGFDHAIDDSNLNSTIDSEEDTNNAFSKYGLNPEKYSDQETFQKLQKFEAENFSSYTQTSSQLRILKPIDEALSVLDEKINNLSSGVVSVQAGESIVKHQLVTFIKELVDESYVLKAYIASAMTVEKISGLLRPYRCHGIALKAANQDDYFNVQLSGIIDDFDFWWNENIDFSYFKNNTMYLIDNGMINDLYPTPTYYTSHEGKDHRFYYMQEIGYSLSNTKLFFNPKIAVLRWANGELPT
jgi:hypothetical protein